MLKINFGKAAALWVTLTGFISLWSSACTFSPSRSTCSMYQSSGNSFYCTNDSPKSTIKVTRDTCSSTSLEYGGAYIWASLSDSPLYCDNDCNTAPCYPCVPDPNDCECNGDYNHVAIVRVNGDEAKFKKLFPYGLNLETSWDPDWTVSIPRANCDRGIRGDSGYYNIILRLGLGYYYSDNADVKDAQFDVSVKFYEERLNGLNACYNQLGAASGTIVIKPNPRVDFDPYNFQPSASSGSDIAWIKQLTNIYDGSQGSDPIWSNLHNISTFDPFDCSCEPVTFGIGPFEGLVPSSATYERVKVPAWALDVCGLPAYMEGWSYVCSETDKFIAYTLDYDTFYFYCNHQAGDTFKLSSIEKGTRPNSTVLWTCQYSTSDPNVLLYVYKGDQRSNPETADAYYKYNWAGSSELNLQYFNQAISTTSPARQWNTKFDEAGQVVESSEGGCSSCGGGSNYQKLEYYYPAYTSDTRFEGLIRRQFNDANDVILWNVYDANAVPYNPNDPNSVYISKPFLTHTYAVDHNNVQAKFTDWVYDVNHLSATEYKYVDNNTKRITKYYYTDQSFSNVAKKIEYETLNDDPNSPTGRTFETLYENIYDDVTHQLKVTQTRYPKKNNGVNTRVDVEEYSASGYVACSYRHDAVNDANVNTQQFTLDGHGNPETTTDARGATTQYYYYNNLLEMQIDPNCGVGISDVNSYHEVDYTYQHRKISTETDSIYNYVDYGYGWGWYVPTKQKQTTYNYDIVTGYLNSIVVDYNCVGYYGDCTESAVTEYRYNLFGQQTREKSPAGVVTGKSYNLAGQLDSEFVLSSPADINEPDANLVLISQTKYQYDTDGHIFKISRAKDNQAFTFGSPVAWIVTQYGYDFLGRKTSVTEDANGLNPLTTTYEYNNQGELTKVTEPSGKWTKTIRDGRGLTIETIIGFGTTDVLTTSYHYDDNGNLDEQTNPDGTVELLTYDNVDRLVKRQKNNTYGPYVVYELNAAGDLIRERHFDVNSVPLADTIKDYDALGRVWKERTLETPDVPNDANDRITLYQFDAAGNLLKTIRKGIGSLDPNDPNEPNDIVVENLYDSLNRIRMTVDGEGLQIAYDYNPDSKLTLQINPEGGQTVNIYDEAGRLYQITDPEGHYKRFGYNSLGQSILQLVYDCNSTPGDANSADDFIVRQVRTDYDSFGRQERQAVMRDPASEDEAQEGVDLVADSVYDEDTGLLYQSKTYYGENATPAVTTYYYDGINRKIRTVDSEDNEQVTVYSQTNPAQVEKTERLEKDPANSANNYTITTFFDYDEFGRIWKKALDEDGDGVWDTGEPTTTYFYDGLDRLIEQIAPDGVVTFSAYDSFGDLRQKIEDYDPQSSTAFNKTTEYVYNRMEQLYQIHAYDPNDTDPQDVAVQTTAYDYNRNGLVAKITYPDQKFIEYYYTMLNKVDMEIQRNGAAVYYWYDKIGNLTAESDDPNAFTNGSPIFIVTYQYDAVGNLLTASKEQDGNSVSVSEFTYNGFGLKTSETAAYFDFNSVTTTWDYDGSGNCISQTHSGITTAYTHDGLGRIVTIDRDDNRIANLGYIGSATKAIEYPEPNVVQSFDYNPLGRISQVRSADVNDNSILDFVYDDYDAVGNRQSEKYNHLIAPLWDKYYYDNLRRLEQADYAAASGFAFAAEDFATPQKMGIQFLALFASQWLNNDAVDLTEIVRNYRTAKTSVNPVKKYSANTKDISLPSTVKNIYSLIEFGETTSDEAGNRAETIRDEQGNIMAQILYNDSGNITLFALYPDSGGKVVITSIYDADGKQSSQVFTTYDEEGNLISREIVPAAETGATDNLELPMSSSLSAESLELDGSGMMMTMMSSTPESPSSATEEFLYDHLGNRFQETTKYGTTYTYSHNTVNQYSKRETEILGFLIEDGYGHDDNGNLSIDAGGYGYTYDYRNRLVKVEDYESNIIAEYVYDAMGRRISKTVGAATTYFYYDTNQRVIAEYEGSPTPELKREFVYGNGFNEVLAMFLPEYEGSEDDVQQFLDFCEAWLSEPNDSNWDNSLDVVDNNRIDFADFAYFASQWDMPSSTESHFYYLTDALGSVRGLVGGMYNRESDREFYNYDAYGQLSIQNPEEGTSGNPYLFAGYRYDSEIALYFMPYRSYDPTTGRFIQMDPHGTLPSGDIRVNPFDPTKQYTEGSCLYQYVNGSPISNKDPFGLFNPRYTRGWCKRGCKGKCGPDITSQFYAMLSRTHKKLDEEFEKPGRKEEICSGEGLFDLGGIYSGHGWEGVTPTYRIGRGENRWPSGSPCENTVVFNGHCVNTWELNYYFWGYLNKKCNTSAMKYHFWTDLYTQYKGTHSPEDPHCKRSFAGTGRCGSPVDASCYYDSCCETTNAPVWNKPIWPIVADLRP